MKMWEQPKLHSGHMELSVAELINPRTQTIVPNVSWGLGLRHECDMLVLDSKNRFTEIEIKISASDLKADFKKVHGHSSKIISRLVYAVPDNLVELAKSICPNDAGIISVIWIANTGKFKANWVRGCKHFKHMEPVPDKTIRKFMELGCMRIWSLKSCLNRKELKKLNS